jgi:cysteine dioxygenase
MAFSNLIADLDRLPLRDSADRDAVVAWLAQAKAGLPTISPPKQFGKKAYTRTLLHKTGAYELIALHWNPNVETMLHDHGGRQCWFAVLDGEMDVHNYRRVDSGDTIGKARIARLGEMHLNPGDIDYRGDDADIHRVVSLKTTTTLHLYAAPLGTYHVFDERRETCEATTSSYDASLTLS